MASRIVLLLKYRGVDTGSLVSRSETPGLSNPQSESVSLGFLVFFPPKRKNKTKAS